MENPYMVDWAVTRECNLKCQHCRGMTPDELSTQDALKVAKEIVGAYNYMPLQPGWVIIEGGEPLLRDGIWDILKVLRKGGLDVNLITNGTLFNSGGLDKSSPCIDNMDRLQELGVKVMLSLDSFYPEVYERIRVGANFDRVVQNGEKLANRGLLHSLNLTLSKDNYRDLPEMFSLCKDMGADMINILGLKPCEKYEEQLLSKEEYKAAIFSVCESAKKSGISFFFDEPFFWPSVEEWGLDPPPPSKESKILVSESSNCIFGDYMFIEPNGDIKPCTFAPYVVGNAKDGVMKVWESMQSSIFLAKIKDPETRTGYCKSCKYLPKCKGCRSRTYALTHDWFASDPACPLVK